MAIHKNKQTRKMLIATIKLSTTMEWTALPTNSYIRLLNFKICQINLLCQCSCKPFSFRLNDSTVTNHFANMPPETHGYALTVVSKFTVWGSRHACWKLYQYEKTTESVSWKTWKTIMWTETPILLFKCSCWLI